MMDKDFKILKKEILHYLCDDFEGNQAIFDSVDGYAKFNGTDLYMVMDKVEKALNICRNKIGGINND